MAAYEKKSKLDLWAWIAVLIIVAAGFWAADTLAVSTGDDLGYAFADSSLHKGDGKRVVMFSDIIESQYAQYFTTNGRFLVHCLVQAFAGIFHRQVFFAVNTLMFLLLWLCSCRFITGLWRPKAGTAIAIAFLIWLAVPRPGIVMLSLVAYAVNYLWTAALTVLFLVLLDIHMRRQTHLHPMTGAFLFIVAFLIGSLQESYSIPLSGALLVAVLIGLVKMQAGAGWLTGGYWCGTLCVFLAPGNFSRLASSTVSFADRCVALGNDLLFSVVTVTAIILVLLFIFAPGKSGWFCRSTFVPLAALFFSLILCIIAYSGVRQLTAPCIFAMIVLGRIAHECDLRFFIDRQWIAFPLIILYAVCAAGIYEARIPAKAKMDFIVDRAKAGYRTLYAPELSGRNEYSLPIISSWFFHRYTCDPTEGVELKLVADGFTKRGLSRLYSPTGEATRINTILPYAPSEIMTEARRSKIEGLTVRTAVLESPALGHPRYVCFAIPAKELKTLKIRELDNRRPGYERFQANDTLWYVVDSNSPTLKIIR